MRLWIIFLITIAAAVAAARPPIVYNTNPPAWYALAPEPGYVKLWRVMPGVRVYYAGIDSLENYFIILSPSTSAQSGWTLQFSTAVVRAGSYSYNFKYSVYAASYTASARLMLLGESQGGNGSAYFYFRRTGVASGTGYAWSVYMHIYVNGVRVTTYYDSSKGGNVTVGSWFQVTFTVPAGSLNFTVYVVASQSSSVSFQTSYDIFMDDIQLYPVMTLAPVETGFDGNGNSWRYSNPYSLTNPYPATMTVLTVNVTAYAKYGGTWYNTTVTLPSTTIPPGGSVTVNAPAATAPLSYQFTFTAQRALARLPSNTGVYAQSGGTYYWLDAVFANTTSATVTIAATQYMYRFTAAETVNVVVTYPDAATASIQNVMDAYIVDTETHAYLNVSTAAGWVKVAEPQIGEWIRLAPIPASSSVAWITFYVYDYGQGFRQVRVYTQDGRIAWREEISSVTQSAVARLQPYYNYIITLWKNGVERAVGPVTIDKTSFTLTVLPTPQPVPPMPFATVIYNQSIGAYIIDVNCLHPPCNVTLMKMTVGYTTIVSYLCSEAYCRFVWQVEDPFLRVTVTDASGNVYSTVTGTSLNMTEQQVRSFQHVFSKIAEHFARFDSAGGVRFAAALGGVLIFLALTIPGFLMVGLIVLAIYNAVVGLLLGFTLLSATALPIILIVGILHYMARHA